MNNKQKNTFTGFIKSSDTLNYLSTYVFDTIKGLFKLVMVAVNEISSLISKSNKVKDS